MFSCSVYSVTRVREKLLTIFETINPIFPVDDSRFHFFSREEEPRPFDADTIAATSQTEENDELELMVSGVGSVSIAWTHDANRPVYQLISLDINVDSRERLLGTLRQLNNEVKSFYSHADLDTASPIFEVEHRSKGRQIPPLGCLRDLYWYNFFGEELVRVLLDHKMNFSIPGLKINSIGHSLEVIVEDCPLERPFDRNIEEYLKSSGVFLRLNPKASFRRKVELDYSQLRTDV